MTERLIQHIATLVALVALSLGVACTPTYTPQPNGVSFSTGETVAHSSTQQFLSIASEYAWTIEIDYLSPEGAEGWCSLSKTSGEGNENVIMSFGKNTLKESRSLSLSVKFPRESIDLIFTQLAEGEKPEPDITTTPKWLELPAFTADNQEVYFSKHMLASSHNKERSFSLLYDSRIYHSLWVAYPISKLHTPGGGSRKDDWGRMDSNIPTDKQVYLRSSFNGSYDRGHLCPAATRFHPDTLENCMQLSIPTNMSPQLSGLNQQKWAEIEKQVRGWGSAKGCDTLYVVTGAVFRTVGGNENISYAYGKSDSSKQVSVPNYYYKALLQRRGTGTSSSFQALAIWVPHKAATGKLTANDIISIDRLEELTGIDFFHNLDDTTEQRVESFYDLLYWGGIN